MSTELPADGTVIPLANSATSGDLPQLSRDDRGLFLPVPEADLVLRWREATDLTTIEIEGLLGLLRRAFNGGPSWFHYGITPFEHFTWRAVDAPDGTLVNVQEPLDGRDGTPIGMGVMRRHQYVVGDQQRTLLHGMDYVLDPSVQGRGIRSTLSRISKITGPAYPEAWTVSFGVAHPIWDHLREVKHDSGVVFFANRLITYAKPLAWSGLRRRHPSRPEQAGASRTRDQLRGYRRKTELKQIARLLVAQLRAAVHRITSPHGVHGEWSIETVDQFGPEADVFWADAATQFDFVQVRDRRYLNWRYCDRRAGRFEVRVAKSGGRMLGFAAIRADEREAVLADLLALPERVDVAEALLDDAIAAARRAGSPTMRLWLQQTHPYAKAVRRRGFFDTDQRMRMRSTRLRDDAPELPFPDGPHGRVHAMIGDSDHV